MLKARILVIFLSLIAALVYSEAKSQPTQNQSITQSKNQRISQLKTVDQEKPSEQFVTHQEFIDAIKRVIDVNNEKYKTFQIKPPPKDNSLWWFNFFLVIFTCCLVIVGGSQCYIIFNTLKETKKTANAAKESAQVARDSLISTRRAFVFLKHITAEPAMIARGLGGNQEAQHWFFSPCWVNMGDTPTKNLTISIHHKVFDYEIPRDFDFPYDNRPNGTTNIPMAIGPKAEAIVGAFGLHYIRKYDYALSSENVMTAELTQA